MQAEAGRISGRLLGSGLLAGATLAAAFLAQQFLLGRSPFAEPGEFSDVWVALVHCFGAAYLPAAYLATLVSGRRSMVELRDRYGLSLEPAAVAPYPPFRRPGPDWIAAGATGLALTFLGPWLTEPAVGGPLWFWNPARWSAEVYWHRFLGLWIGLWIGWYSIAVFQVSRRLSALARTMPGVDLFDHAPLRPFVRHGLSNALTAAGIATIVGLLGLDLGLTMMLVVFGSLALALVGVAGALPMLGVRDRIRTVRSAELAWCDAAIRMERARLRDGTASTREGRLADLVAYRGLAEAVDLWPIDTPTLRRTFLYLLIPVLSWTASAVVQALVERAIR